MKGWLATAKPKPLSLFISLFQHCQMLLSTKIREMKSECGFSLALKLEKGSAALTCGPLRCALATALERARSRRVSSRRVSSCCSAGEEEQQETPAAAWCTLFLNILCILCTVFLNVEEHAQLSEAQRACNGQGHELSKDTRGALHSRQTAANGMGERA